MTGTDGLLGPADVAGLAAQCGLRPTKSLGQNFLTDANTIRRIVRVADLAPDDVVLEVGPGLGSLTLGLLPAVSRVVAVEIDPTLAAQLPATVAERLPAFAGRLDVLTADALRVEHVAGPAPTAMVANLPYNVAVPVVLTLLARFASLRQILVMVQAEVAGRLAAPPGSRTYGVPSAKAAWYADVRRAGAIGRRVFWPEPRVDSALVSMTRHPPPAGADRVATFAVIDAAFGQRRKMIRSALAGPAGSPVRAEEAIRSAGLDPRARGEALTVHDFARIAHAIARLGPR